MRLGLAPQIKCRGVATEGCWNKFVCLCDSKEFNGLITKKNILELKKTYLNFSARTCVFYSLNED